MDDLHNFIRMSKVAAPALLSLSLWLGACSGIGGMADFNQIRAPKLDTSTIFVPNPTQFAPKQESATPVAPADFVDGNGYCADMGAPSAPPPAAENAAAPATAAEPLPAVMPSGRGVALQMSECEVVRAAGHPASAQISANERGDRLVTMIYNTPERPIYRFTSGRLTLIERGAEPPPEAAKKKPVKKKRG